jgi:hypothetical protein
VCTCGTSHPRRGQQALVDHPARLGVGGALAASSDRVVVRAAHGRAGDREDRVHVRGPGPRGDPQLQRRRVRLVDPKYAGGRPPKFTLPQRQEIKKIALSRPTDHDLPFSTWSLSKLAEFLVAEGVVDDISHEGLRVAAPRGRRLVSSDQDVQGPTTPTSKRRRTGSSSSTRSPTANPCLARVIPTVVICMDEFGPLNLQPHPGKQWAPIAAGKGDTESPAASSPDACHLQPAPRCPSPDGRLRPVDQPALRPRREEEGPNRVLGVRVATCGRCTRPTCASRSCSTTSARTCQPRRTSVSASGPRRTTSSSPTRRSTRHG